MKIERENKCTCAGTDGNAPLAYRLSIITARGIDAG
jgi:hypothetical protein